MKKYRDRHLKKISRAIGIAYLITAILWGFSTYHFQNERDDLREMFDSGEISHQEFLKESMEFTEKESKMFGTLTSVFVGNTIADFAFSFVEKDKDM